MKFWKAFLLVLTSWQVFDGYSGRIEGNLAFSGVNGFKIVAAEEVLLEGFFDDTKEVNEKEEFLTDKKSIDFKYKPGKFDVFIRYCTS